MTDCMLLRAGVRGGEGRKASPPRTSGSEFYGIYCKAAVVEWCTKLKSLILIIR